MKNKNYFTPALVSIGLLFGVYSCTTVAGSGEGAGSANKDAGAVMDAKSIALSEKMIFEKASFRLKQETQEGTTVKQRLEQDSIQKSCSALAGGTVDSATAASVRDTATKSIKKPAGGVKLGDWKKGEVVARSGYGFRVGHKTDKHGKRDAGGNCYACHALDPKELAFGTVGTSLVGYGKTRGTSDAMLNFAHGIIYNPHATFPCTDMPRFGYNKVLTEQQISDVMAYLFDPKSPVNQ